MHLRVSRRGMRRLVAIVGAVAIVATGVVCAGRPAPSPGQDDVHGLATQSSMPTAGVALTAPGRICGYLSAVGSDGAPGVRVVAAGSAKFSATTDADGDFELAGLPAGSYRVIAYGWDAGHATVTAGPVTVRGGQSVSVGSLDISASTAGTVRGTVGIDESSGPGAASGDPDEPAAKVTIYVVDADGVVRGRGTTDASGVYTIPRILPGTYTVGAQGAFDTEVPAADPSLSVLAVQQEGVAVTDGAATTVDLEFLRAGSIGILVNDAGGNEISGAQVELSDASGNAVELGAIDSTGGVYMPSAPLVADDYTLSVSASGYGTATQKVTIVAGVRLAVTITLVAE